MKERIELLDTTLRDGAQGEGVELSLEDKRRLAQALDRLGVPLIEGGNPAANPKDREFFQQALDRPFLQSAKLVPFGSTCRAGAEPEADEGLRALASTGQDTVCVFGKADVRQAKGVLRVTPGENLRMIEQSVRFLHDGGLRVLFDAEHYFDGAGFDPAYALEALRAALRGGADVLVLCDTRGGTLPDDARERTLLAARALPGARLGAHCHDDMGLAVACTLAAVGAGARMAQVTMAGVGERCGNANLFTLLPTLQLKLGYDAVPAERLPLLTGVAREAQERLNLAPSPRAPYVGVSAFAHKGGMHIDGVLKDAATFEHIEPERVGNRRRFLLSEQAGRAGVYARMKRLVPDLCADDPRVQSVLERLKRRELRGYAYEGADGSFDLLALDTLGLHKAHFEVRDFHVLSGTARDERSAQAYIKISVDGREEINAAEGDGPVNALDLAMRKALQVFYPQLRSVRLRDFRVRVVDGLGTASAVRVVIESTDGRSAWTTTGVSSNIIQACLAALQDSVEYYLAFLA